MNFYKITEAFSNPKCEAYIPDDYKYIFKETTCLACGEVLEINDNRTIVRCSNPNCSIKLSYSILKMLQHLSIKGIGISGVSRYIEDNNRAVRKWELVGRDAAQGIYEERMKTYLDGRKRWCNLNDKESWEYPLETPKLQTYPILDIESKFDIGEPAHTIRNRSDFLRNPPSFLEEPIQASLKVPRTFAEAISCYHIQGMVTKSLKLFNGCDSYDQFLKKIDEYGGLGKFIQATIVKKEDSDTAKLVFKQVLKHRTDLHAASELFTIVPSDFMQTNIVITGNILNVTTETGGTMYKGTFIRVLNDKLAETGKRLILQQRVTEATKILVSDSGGSTNCESAIRINKSREFSDKTPIVICTSDELYDEVFGEPTGGSEGGNEGPSNDSKSHNKGKLNSNGDPEFNNTSLF